MVSSGNKAVNQNGAYQRGVAYPACAGAAISVGATTDAAMWESSSCNGASAANQVTSFSQSANTSSSYRTTRRSRLRKCSTSSVRG